MTTKTQQKQITAIELDEKQIAKLQAKDLEAYNQGRKSFTLNNFIKDEIVLTCLCENWEEIKIKATAKTFSKIIVPLAYLRQQGIININDNFFNLLDVENVEIKLTTIFDNLPNYYRRYLNQNYNLQLEMREEEPEEDDFTLHAKLFEKLERLEKVTPNKD